MWSQINRKKVARLIAEKKMTKAGLAEVERAKKNGRWAAAMHANLKTAMPQEFAAAPSAQARELYAGLAPGYQRLYRRYVAEAKLSETRQRRAKWAAKWLLKGLKNPWGASQA